MPIDGLCNGAVYLLIKGRLRVAISALSCSIIRASSALGCVSYLASNSASAFSRERRFLSAFSIRSTSPTAEPLSSVRGGVLRLDRFRRLVEAAGQREPRFSVGVSGLAHDRPRCRSLVPVFLDPRKLRGVRHDGNPIQTSRANGGFDVGFRRCGSPPHGGQRGTVTPRALGANSTAFNRRAVTTATS